MWISSNRFNASRYWWVIVWFFLVGLVKINIFGPINTQQLALLRWILDKVFDVSNTLIMWLKSWCMVNQGFNIFYEFFRKFSLRTRTSILFRELACCENLALSLLIIRDIQKFCHYLQFAIFNFNSQFFGIFYKFLVF